MNENFLGFFTDDAWDHENGFYLTSPVNRLPKAIAQYELYKSIVSLPGHILECGVFKGASFIRFCTYREILESPFSRKIIGFDTFDEFPRQKDIQDQNFIDSFQASSGTAISLSELEKVLLYKKFQNYELIEGDLSATLPHYIENHPELRLALLHIDVDIYQPTKDALELLYERIVPGGLLVLDDYGAVAGETIAVDEFFRDKGIKIEKLTISHVPSFIRKP